MPISKVNKNKLLAATVGTIVVFVTWHFITNSSSSSEPETYCSRCAGGAR